MDLLIKNGTVVTMDKERRVLKNFSIAMDEGKIVEIAEKVKGSADVVIDANSKIVLPGLINTHTHLPMTLFRGVADDIPLSKWLNEEIWPMEAKLEAKHVYAGSLLGCLEMIKSGTTTFNDMYFFIDDIARAVNEAGIRGVLSYAMFDFDSEEKLKKYVNEGEQVVKKYCTMNNSRVHAFFGPHAPYTCSEGLLVETKKLADKYGTGIHIHVAETKQEVVNAKKRFGATPFEYLERIGFLGENVVAAHATYATKKEIEIIKNRGVKIAHNPVCNMKLASGIAPVPEYLDSGVLVSLGSDGAASNNSLDLFDDMKVCALLHKISKMDPSLLSALQVLEFATINAARALGLEKEIGSIEVGKRGDIILVDLKRPNLMPLTNPVSHLVYAARGCDVATVIVDGKIVMEDRKLRTLDQKGVLKFAAEQAKDLFEKTGKENRLF